MRWTPDRQAELVALAAAGVTAAQIAEAMGCTIAAIRSRASKTSVKLPIDPEVLRRYRGAIANLARAHDDPGFRARRASPDRAAKISAALRAHHERKRPPVIERPDRSAPPSGRAREIELTRGYATIVDEEDFEWLSQWRWTAKVTPHGSVYAVSCPGGRTVHMGRLIMDPPQGMVVDHIDGNPLNNRRANLRICQQRQNSYNRRKLAHRRYIGVQPSKKRWMAVIAANGVRQYLGLYRTAEEAARVRDEAAKRLHGEFAKLNFPEVATP